MFQEFFSVAVIYATEVSYQIFTIKSLLPKFCPSFSSMTPESDMLDLVTEIAQMVYCS